MNPEILDSQVVVHLDGFRFNTLHKYMHPIYAELDRNARIPIEEKRLIVSWIIPLFFVRMREYRGVSLSEVAARSSIDEERLERFESGEVGATADIVASYSSSCGGGGEFEFFEQALREFREPAARVSKIGCAKDVFLRFGIKMPGVDYQAPGMAKGVVLEMKGRQR